MILNELFNSKRQDWDSKAIEEKVLDLIKEKGALTFPEIVKELKIENGDRDFLLEVLSRLIIERRLKKEKTHINFGEGVILTSRFFL